MQNVNIKPKIPAPPLRRFKAEIEALAKEIFLKRQESKTEGDTLADWLQAEKSVKIKYSIP